MVPCCHPCSYPSGSGEWRLPPLNPLAADCPRKANQTVTDPLQLVTLCLGACARNLGIFPSCHSSPFIGFCSLSSSSRPSITMITYLLSFPSMLLAVLSLSSFPSWVEQPPLLPAELPLENTPPNPLHGLPSPNGIVSPVLKESTMDVNAGLYCD